MPKVTLLGNKNGVIHVMGFGRRYDFKTGVPVLVPDVVAASLAKRVDRRGKQIFKIEVVPVVTPVKQNVDSANHITKISQPRLVEPWPSA